MKLHPQRRAICVTVVALLLTLSAPLRAALLSHDGLAYPANTLLPGQNGGEGFSGSWLAGVNAGVTVSRFQVVSPSLSYPGLATGSLRLRVTAGAAQGARRNLSQTMGADGTVRYVSLLVRPDATPSASSYFGLQLLGSAGADLFVGKPGGGATGKYVLENAGGSGQVATTRNVTANEVVLLVVRLEFNAGNDRISLYVNPALGPVEPAIADAVKTDLNLGTTVVPALTGPAAWSADELRVGTTFADVTPPAPDFQLRPVQAGNVAEHILVTRQVETVDALPPGRTLTFDLVGQTFGAQIDPATGEFTWVPGELDGGERRTFTLRATSNANPPASATVSFFLDVTEANFPPQLAEVPNQSVREGSELTYQLVATDEDVPIQNISYALTVKPVGLTVSSAGVLSWRPTFAQAGRTYPVTVLAIDTMAGRAERSFTITVQPRTGFFARWTRASNGDWNNPANWDIGRVPNDNATEYFDVRFESHPVTIQVAGNITVRSLSLGSGATLDLPSPTDSLAIQSSLFWNNGTLAGQGRVTVRGNTTFANGGGNSALTLRDQCRLVLSGNSELGTTLRCDGNVQLVLESSAFLGVPHYGGFVRMGGVPEIINDGRISIWGQQQSIPFIYILNRGTLAAFTSTLDFDSGAGIDLLQETGGHLSIGAGFDHGATLDGYALIRPGSTVFGQGYIRQARVEGQIQGRINFNQLEFGPTAVSRFSLAGTHDRLTAAQPVSLAGQMELLAGPDFDPEPDAVIPIVVSAGNVTGGFAGRPFGQRVQIPGTGQSLLLTRSADSYRVELRRYLPPPISLSAAPLSFRMAEAGGQLGGCFVAPDPAVILPEATFPGAGLRVEITDGYDAAVDRLEFRPNPAFPEADEITFEELAGGVQRVRFRGTDFGTVQLDGGLMTCVLNAQADSESVIALLGQLRYENTELRADWFTGPGMNYPQRTIVVTLTDALGSTEVSRIVTFPILWGILLPESLLLPEGRPATLHLLGRFSNEQVLPVRKLVVTWSDGGCGVLSSAVAGFPGQHQIVGKPAPYCCTVTAGTNSLFASTEVYEGVEVELEYPPGSLLGIFLDLVSINPLGDAPLDCPALRAFTHAYVVPECYTTPAFQASGSGQPPTYSPAPLYALESLMKGTAAGQRWAGLYREHGAEVLRLFLEHPPLFTQAKELLTTFQPGVVALLAGRGDTVPIYVPMITRVNDFWNALAEHASPALKTVLEQEQARFDNFRMFQNRTFNEWAGLLGIQVPFQPYLHISLMQREATKFHVALNDLPGVNVSLWRSTNLETWTQVANAGIQRDGTTLILTDPAPPAGQAFYQIRQ